MRILPRCKLHLPAFLVILSYFWHNFSPPEDFTSVKTRFFPSFFVKKEILFLIRIPFSVHNLLLKFMYFSYFFSGYFSVSASTIARAFAKPSSPSLITMEIASAI